MPLTRVTLSGADDRVDPAALAALSAQYPWVEWGLLASRSRLGTPRYPGYAWVRALQAQARHHPMALALHLCGAWASQFLEGAHTLPAGLLDGFQRVQLNLAREVDTWSADLVRCAEALRTLGERQVLIQVRHRFTAQVLEAAADAGIDAIPLFDASGGRGLTPPAWPSPGTLACPYPAYGYAGGLGPHNLAEELPRIDAVAGWVPYSVDMETSLRTDDQFDLTTVRTCLDIAAPSVRRLAQLHTP